MAKNINKIAKILGAKIVAHVPETGGGAFGAYRLGDAVGRLQTRIESGDDERRDAVYNRPEERPK